MLKYVIGGLKLTPSQPTFVQARDAIISAASALQPADVPLIWNGFAKRGMGKNAKAPPHLFNVLDGGRRELRRP